MTRWILGLVLLAAFAACERSSGPPSSIPSPPSPPTVPQTENPLLTPERLITLGFVRDEEFPELYSRRNLTVREAEDFFEVKIEDFRPTTNQSHDSDKRYLVTDGVNIRLESRAPRGEISKSLSRRDTPCDVFVNSYTRR